VCGSTVPSSTQCAGNHRDNTFCGHTFSMEHSRNRNGFRYNLITVIPLYGGEGEEEAEEQREECLIGFSVCWIIRCLRMARNAEKARSMLHRYLKSKAADSVENNNKAKTRPHLAVLCDDIQSARQFRDQIIKEFSHCVSQLNNTSKSRSEEDTLKLNDTANKLLREKKHWERQIVRLGGSKDEFVNRNSDGGDGMNEMNGGEYVYFGVAKEIDGVREELEREQKRKMKLEHRKTQRIEDEAKLKDLYKKLDREYFGWDVEYSDEIHTVLDKVKQEMEQDGDFVVASGEEIELVKSKIQVEERLKQKMVGKIRKN